MSTSASRTSAMHDAHVAAEPTWATLESMSMPVAFDDGDAERRNIAGIADVSFRRRLGLKGPEASNWLQRQGLTIPPRPNQWCALEGGALLLRLGRNEYLLEEPSGSQRCSALGEALISARGVYAVPRFDAALLLGGARLRDLLLQTCSFDFDAIPPGEPAVVMTSMIGIGVTLAVIDAPERSLRLWCDGSYGHSLWTTLVEIAGELGGGAVGVGVGQIQFTPKEAP